IKAADKVEYYYPEPKNRFLSIIAEQKPWCVSRERVWGAPLPIWVCSNCKHKNALFNREEIIKNAKELPDGADFELHRPWIDKIIIKCEKCNGDAYREPFVLDTWHNSGAAPYASLTDEEFNELVPVPFLTEGIDQTRGWAYTLLIESVIMYGDAKAPFRSFLFQGHVLDEKGNKMSKSLGNVIDGYEMVSKYPADLIRLYFIWKASPIDPLNFSINEMLKRTYQILNTLYNLHVYFLQNSSYDKFDINKHNLRWAIDNNLLKESEIWLLSRLERVKEIVTNSYERCRYHEGARALENFIINDLSQTYLPLTRNELWSDDEASKNRRLAIYAILSDALFTTDILLHPITPFITDYLAVKAFNKDSILLERWPKKEPKFVNDQIEKAFDIISNVISIANAARNKAGLKRRWPLSKAYIAIKRDDAKILRNYIELLKSQINVQEVKIVELKDKMVDNIIIMLDNMLPITLRLSLNRRKIAPRVKADLKKVLDAFNNLDYNQVIRELSNGKFVLAYDNKEVEISIDDVDIDYEVKEGYTLAERDGIFVFLTTERDQELIAKGVVRDIARRLQALRKERGYNPTDILNVAYVANLDDNIVNLLENLLDELAYLVRVKEVKLLKDAMDGVNWQESELDGKKILISIE
ncbi:MAG: isoleucine--tRNA ligase, partial [Candidatus Nitrosothermus koennekii]